MVFSNKPHSPFARRSSLTLLCAEPMRFNRANLSSTPVRYHVASGIKADQQQRGLQSPARAVAARTMFCSSALPVAVAYSRASVSRRCRNSTARQVM